MSLPCLKDVVLMPCGVGHGIEGPQESLVRLHSSRQSLEQCADSPFMPTLIRVMLHLCWMVIPLGCSALGQCLQCSYLAASTLRSV